MDVVAVSITVVLTVVFHDFELHCKIGNPTILPLNDCNHQHKSPLEILFNLVKWPVKPCLLARVV